MRRDLFLIIKPVLLFTILLLILVAGGCDEDAFQPGISNDDGEILIALPGPLYYMEEGSHFLKGVEMALKEVNAEGLIDDRELDIIVADDRGSFMEGVSLARSFVNKDAVSAVIGHWHSHITLPASEIYEENGLVMLSPIVSNVDLTAEDKRFIFRNIPGDDEIGRQMAYFARDNALERIVLFYADTPYGLGLVNAFEETASEIGIVILDSINGFVDNHDRKRAIDRWDALGYEAIFVASSLEDASSFISGIRKEGVEKPILGGDGLDVGIIEELGEDAEGVVVATIINPDHHTPAMNEFLTDFRGEYGVDPDVWGIQGYDSVKLIAHAIREGGSAEPEMIAETLHNMKEWDGLLGSFSFNEKGEAEGISVYQKEVQSGRFIYLNK